MPWLCTGISARELSLHLFFCHAFPPRTSLHVTGRDSARPAGIPSCSPRGALDLAGVAPSSCIQFKDTQQASPPHPQLKAPPTLGSLGHVWPWGIHWLVARCWHLFTSLQRGGNICKSQHVWPLTLAACPLPCPLWAFPTQLPSSPRMLPSLLHATNNSSPPKPSPTWLFTCQPRCCLFIYFCRNVESLICSLERPLFAPYPTG